MDKNHHCEIIYNRKNLRDQLKASLFTKPKLNIPKKNTKKSKNFSEGDFFDEYELLEDEILGDGAHAVVK